MKKYNSLVHLSFILFTLALLLSCTKPNPKNPFDPETELTSMQGQLSLTQLTDSHVKLHWQLNEEIVDHYRIEKKINSGTYVFLANVDASINNFTDIGLSTQNIYYYRVFGVNDENQTGPISNSIQTTFAGITNFNIQQENIFTAHLTWSHNCNYEEGYIIERTEVSEKVSEKSMTPLPTSEAVDQSSRGDRRNSKLRFETKENNISRNTRDFIEIANLPANTTQYIDDSLLPTHSYEYRVKAYTIWNESGYTNSQISLTFPGPTDLVAIPFEVSQVELSWSDNCNWEEGYKIEKKENNGNFIEIGSTSQSNFIVSNLNFSSDYIFRVRAYYANYNSNYSNESLVNIRETITPANLQGSAISFTEIEIHWTDNCTFEDGLIIQRKEQGGIYQTINVNSSNDTTYIDTMLIPDNYYYYRIAAECGSNQSSWSDESIILCIPENIIIVDCNGNGDYLIIQDGINEAINGDTILVRPGIYVENINFYEKNITVASVFFITQDSTYISQTIIDGNQYDCVVRFSNNVSSEAVLSGFTITNGYAISGGGILCISSNPTLKNLIITGNNCDTTSGDGGGISCLQNSNPIIKNVKIVDNYVAYFGGGIYCSSSNPSLVNVTITGNIAAWSGGGIYCVYNSNPNFENVTISGNSAEVYGDGGGIFCENNSTPSLINCIMWNNFPQEIYFSQFSNPVSVIISYSDIQDGFAGIITNDNGFVNWLEGNIDADPIFVDPIEPSQAPTDEGDFHLQPGSPCIDAGNPDPQYNDPDATRNDMGAYGGPGGDW